jgi:hypothetical protein
MSNVSTPLLGVSLTNDVYHSDKTRISKSGLDLINKAPAHYYYKYLDPNYKKPAEEPTWAKTGNLTGAAILEPDVFKDSYAVLDDSEICKEIGGARPTTTNKYKEWMAAELPKFAGKTLVTGEEMTEAIAMRDSVHKNKACAFLLKEGQAERTFYFKDPVTGVLCRIRPDWLALAAEWIVDVKTTVSAHPDDFARSIYKYRYHVQDPFYTDGLKHNGHNFKGFCFIVVEKAPPHIAEVYFIPAEAKALGRKEISNNLATYAKCLDSGVWPGYTGGLLTELNVPAWAYNK